MSATDVLERVDLDLEVTVLRVWLTPLWGEEKLVPEREAAADGTMFVADWRWEEFGHDEFTVDAVLVRSSVGRERVVDDMESVYVEWIDDGLRFGVGRGWLP